MQNFISQEENLLGGIDENIYKSFEPLALRLIIRAYQRMKEEPEKRDEEWYSAILKGHIEKLCSSYSLETGIQWDVRREDPRDDERIRMGKLNPRKAGRIDIVVTCWPKLGKRTPFPFESKKISETNNDLIRLYVEDGLIDRYLNKEKDYASGQLWGGMIGYILQGSHVKIIDKLNEQIDKQLGNSDEYLFLDKPVDDFDLIYKSQHKHPSINDMLTITHLLFYFLSDDTNT